jgi:MFS transporter, Spinster family, sphingosine-1-phosphate transporter
MSDRSPAAPLPTRPSPAGLPEDPARVGRAAVGLLLFLTLLNILNFVDRTLIASLAPLLIADLGLSRTQIGLLAGFGFVVLYTLVGIFLGLAADRWPRLRLLAGGLALWSAMTALSGLAKSFLHLVIPRIFVGVGEATLTPAALSMLGDAFPRRRLGFATGVYYTGVPLGMASSLLVASVVAPRWGWRACFFLLGGIGLVAVLALRLFREPARRSALGPDGPGSGTQRPQRPQRSQPAALPPVRDLLRDVAAALARRRELLFVLLGGALLCFGSGAAMLSVTWLVEDRGYPYPRATLLAGGMAVAAGLLGNLAGGHFGDWCARRFRQGRLWSLAAMTAFFTPSALIFYHLTPGTPLFFVGWFLTSAATSVWFGPFFATVQELSPAHTRSTMIAFALLVINLLGVGPGPLVTGMIGDAYGLTLGLVASQCVVGCAVFAFLLAARAARRQEVAEGPRASG